jgi:subtilisin family serine protease/subtilisin-like proprotein convertase family protein
MDCRGLRLESLEDRSVPSTTPINYDPSRIIVGYRSPSGVDLQTVTLGSGITVAEALNRLKSDSRVAFAEPDYTVSISVIPNDASFGSLWGLHNTGQSGGTVDADIDAPEAWDLRIGNLQTVVGVVDTGIDYRHRDLYRNIWINQQEIPSYVSNNLTDADGDGLFTFWDLNDAANAGKVRDWNGNGYIDAGDILDNRSGWEDGSDNDGNGYVDDLIGWDWVNNDNDPLDDHNHGTHVAGTIGATGNDGVGVVGVNWRVQMVPLKFLSASGSGATSDAVNAVNYMIGKNIKISNNSWGGGGYSSALYNAIRSAQDINHVFVAAAGNSSANNDSMGFYPANYNLDNIISVAATTRNDTLASFSNYGATTVDLGAPGASIYSTIRNGGYGTYSGTSMAAPHVTGVVALVRSGNPDLSYNDTIQRILQSVDPLPTLSGITVTGGRLNAFNAIYEPPPPSDLDGPRITAADPNASGKNPVSAVRVTFNESILVTSFDASDVVLTDPNGATIAITGVVEVSGSNGTQFDVQFDAQSVPGTYTMTIGPTVTDLAGNPMDQDQDKVLGEPGDDEYTATFTITSIVTYTQNTPLSIPDRSTVESKLVIGDDFKIGDLNVQINISHTYDSDLIVWLIGPDGTVATLVNRRGGSGDNFDGTVFDDEATVPIRNGKAPFAGTYKPETALSVFDGKSTKGTWKLRVRDAARYDVGTLNSWSITVDPSSGPAGGPAMQPPTRTRPITRSSPWPIRLLASPDTITDPARNNAQQALQRVPNRLRHQVSISVAPRLPIVQPPVVPSGSPVVIESPVSSAPTQSILDSFLRGES